MNLVVHKYGGSILSNEELREKACVHIIDDLKKGNKVVVIVSAFGRINDPYSTDTLLKDSKYLSNKERDRLLSIGETYASLVMSNLLLEKGYKSYALDNKEIGICKFY